MPERSDLIASPSVAVSEVLSPTDTIPNNSRCPLIVYRAAVLMGELGTGTPTALSDSPDPATIFESLFQSNGWGDGWRNGVFPFHHFHSTAHEVLGVYSGNARVQFGGDDGLTLDIAAGDVVIVPAGVGHKKLSSSNLAIVGAYPRGQAPDLCRPDAAQLAQRTRAVAAVGCPDCDPVYGTEGPLRQLWPITG